MNKYAHALHHVCPQNETAATHRRRDVHRRAIVETKRDGDEVKQRVTQHIEVSRDQPQLERLVRLGESLHNVIEADERVSLYRPEDLPVADVSEGGATAADADAVDGVTRHVMTYMIVREFVAVSFSICSRERAISRITSRLSA